MNEISTNLFTFNKNEKMVSSELSSLSLVKACFQQLYDDAVDEEGLALFSEKTGRTSHWYFDSKEYNEDGDLLYYVLKPCLDDPVNVGMKGWKMFLFND